MPNPKLKRIPRAALPEPMGTAHDRSMKLRGDATFFEVFGNHPELYRWYTESFYGEVFHGGVVERRIKELVRYRLSTLHGCRFCNQGNRVDALDAGLSEDELDRIDDNETAAFSEREKAALALADRLSLVTADGELDTELHERLRQHFSDAEILELGLVLGVLSGMAKFLFAYDLVEKEPSCAMPTLQETKHGS